MAEKQPLTGTYGKLWLDGEEVALVTNIQINAIINYEDYYDGVDVERVPVSQQGEGNVSFEAYDSFHTTLWEKMKNCKNPKFVIEANLADPKVGGKIEGYQLNGVTFDEVPLANWEKGSKVAKELSFRHKLSQMVILDTIVE